jgi:hypothetical protein
MHGLLMSHHPRSQFLMVSGSLAEILHPFMDMAHCKQPGWSSTAELRDKESLLAHEPIS